MYKKGKKMIQLVYNIRKKVNSDLVMFKQISLGEGFYEQGSKPVCEGEYIVLFFPSSFDEVKAAEAEGYKFITKSQFLLSYEIGEGFVEDKRYEIVCDCCGKTISKVYKKTIFITGS
jgi:hypothetical protein